MKKARLFLWLSGGLLALFLASGCASSKAALKPDELGATDEEKKALALTLFKEGAELLDKDNQAARSKFSEAIEVDPTMIAAYFNRGLAEEALGDFKGAQHSYESCLVQNKSQGACLENLIVVKIKLADHEGAKTLAESYLAEFPEEPFAQVAAAKRAFLENDLSNAENYARAAIEREAENVEALYVMARIFYVRKEYAAAKWVAKNALEIAPSHGGLNLLLGHTYVELDLLHDALDSYRLAVKYQPTEEALESYGLILLKRGRVKEGLSELERVAKGWPLEYRHYLHLGNAYMADKQFEQSLAAYLKAMELKPDDKDSNFNLGLLYYDLKTGSLPELERLKTAESYFKAYLEIPNLSKERIKEVNDYLASLSTKIEMEEYAIQSAKEQANEPEPEPEPEEESSSPAPPEPDEAAPLEPALEEEKIIEEEIVEPIPAEVVVPEEPKKEKAAPELPKVEKKKEEKDLFDEEDEDFFEE